MTGEVTSVSPEKGRVLVKTPAAGCCFTSRPRRSRT
jgi:hypothetical protein